MQTPPCTPRSLAHLFRQGALLKPVSVVDDKVWVKASQIDIARHAVGRPWGNSGKTVAMAIVWSIARIFSECGQNGKEARCTVRIRLCAA